ncbi:MAG TPA: hypothetical protein DD671_19470, partial [Balneolaceae bacterium]|nr:hypothetical protein [Balneolaceae bacterium]
MSVSNVALAATKLVGAIYEWDPNLGSSYMNNAAKEKIVKKLLDKVLFDATEENGQIKLVPNENKDKFIEMIKAMTLLTSGNVDTLRDPEQYDSRKSERWSRILSEPSEFVLKYLRFPFYEQITKEDYEKAKVILPEIGSSSSLTSEVLDVFGTLEGSDKQSRFEFILSGMSSEDDEDSGPKWKKTIRGYDKLYRGLHLMNDNAVILLTELGAPWDMERGVSTSRSQRVAEDFADIEGPNNILLTIDDPERKGFPALSLSKFEGEEEVILSGMIEIYNYELNFLIKEEFEGSSFINDGMHVQADPTSIIITKPQSGELVYAREDSHTTPEKVHNFIKNILGGLSVNITRESDGKKI